MDEYYMLQFFKFVYDQSGDRPLPTFQYPAHFETLDDAKVFAGFWMRFGFLTRAAVTSTLIRFVSFRGN